MLLDAAARLTADAQVALAGTGLDEGALRARADRLGLSGRVRFLGFAPGQDLRGLYRPADILVSDPGRRAGWAGRACGSLAATICTARWRNGKRCTEC